MTAPSFETRHELPAPGEAPLGPNDGDWPIQDMAALGDGRSVALIAPDGAIIWWCVPAIDSPALFDRLLDAYIGGYFQIRPDTACTVTRRYRDDSNVLETVFETETGRVRLTESLNSSLAGRLPWSELARLLVCERGHMTLHISARFGRQFNAVSPWIRHHPGNHGLVFHVEQTMGQLLVSENVTIEYRNDIGFAGHVALHRDERAMVAVVATRNEPLCIPTLQEIEDRISDSDHAWQRWTESLTYDGPYRGVVRRSALALKLLLSSHSGAIAAAATMGLPEKIGGPKNYDYRYAWVRDAAYTVCAFLRLGVRPESKAGFTWLIHRMADAGLRVFYTLDGAAPPSTHDVNDIRGYRRSQPVMIGNAATHQHQHGIYGDILHVASMFTQSGHLLDMNTGILLSNIVDECADRWRQRDAGIWELADPEHYTMSKISAWQALARGAELARQGYLPSTCADRWERERDRIAEWIDDHCWSEKKKAYTFYRGTERLDASIALAAAFGFPRPERLRSTMDAIARELGAGPFIYRYSGAAQEEGSFLACAFWLAEAQHILGRTEDAARRYNAILAAIAPSTGTISEMIDPATGAHLGNTPQGLTHLAIVHAACIMAGKTQP
ncbi:glycoside hydrolase family 15 protein [Tanticharoenia sakaeratensis]|uniref:Glycoside hydrolase 15-related protein n=1 Tax=Tanticharoenia sakaeratensis NBRC 103193 TaxID=1231623 RepID=A0A0D6MLU1_9PROT|nr:glycoside hydrolase family 15 protein [Tanticharoenia sakaeratensis]GAN54654.1 glycoside hydrolase 15-related protein [Tanticharoenia sakaeratensis NBRC 103193]GBQ16734.1 glycosyl hydrolase [Tanticharoenia sakaeratensis NBRC 103193]